MCAHNALAKKLEIFSSFASFLLSRNLDNKFEKRDKIVTATDMMTCHDWRRLLFALKGKTHLPLVVKYS